jgi:CHAT domain-containing protein
MIAGDPAVLDKTAWITLASRLYVEHFTLLAEHGGKPAKAFSVVEQVRGRVITDVLLAGGSTASGNARRTEESISKARFELSRAKTTADVRSIRDELFFLSQRRWIDPDLRVLKAQTNLHVELSQVQRLMDPHSVILEYVLAEPHSYCVVIRSKSARILSIAPKSVIDDGVTAFLKAVKSKQASATAAQHLNDVLLTPVNELRDAQNVLIVRDGLLNLLPFDALEDSRGAAFGNAKVVSYIPSAASFYLIASQTPPVGARENLFAVGDIPYGGASDAALAENVTRDANQSHLSNLPSSREEILSAAAAFDDQRTTLLMGSTGTKAAVEKARLKDYRVLHFAVHGIADETHPDQAALVFLSDPTTREDGLLSATEVAQLRLRANLVLLSACDTAVGPIEGQEGIANLSRAFLLAGARSVISTLWAVDDNSSLALLKEFYKNYRRTGSPAESLALAKRTMLARFGQAALPYYWAAFAFEGVPESAIAHHAQHN